MDIEDLEQKVREIENTVLYSESKRLDEEEVTRLMKAFIAKNRIQNQGYVLDNYPKTTKQVIKKHSLTRVGISTKIVKLNLFQIETKIKNL